MNGIVETLIARQREYDESDAEFATRMGIPESTWKLTRLGYRRLAGRVARAAMQAFPDMEDSCSLFLLTGVTSDTLDVSTDSKETA